MPKREKAIIGAPCWIELVPSDLEAVKPFYKQIFNWDFEDVGADMGHYNIISVDGDVVGGAMQHDASSMGEWANYFSVFFATNDVAASLKKGEELGGHTAMPAMEVPGQGTFGVASDPCGAVYCLWAPGGRQGFDKFGEHGFPAWFELQTRDFAAESAFYAGVLGAELGTDEMGEGMTYHTLRINGEDQAGIFDITGILPEEVPTSWNIYFAVDDTDAAFAKALELGGSVMMEPQDTPYGRMAVFADPKGTAVSIIGMMSES